MFQMFNQFFAALSTLFSAAEKGAKALDHVATIAEIKAKGYEDNERIKIKIAQAQLQRELDQQMRVIEAPAT